MITHISLRNFQSWKKLDLALGGITVIVGKGNGGKSAILRAIRNALTNRGGDGFIRQGEAEAVVGLAFDDHALVWTKRRGKGGEYDLDGQTYSKTGQTVPEDIAKATAVRGVAIDKTTTVYPQIHGQWDAPFIVKASGTQRARILGKLTKLDVLVQAQMLARADIDRADRRGVALLGEIESLKSSLLSLPDTAALRTEYDTLREDTEEAISAYEKAERAVKVYRQRDDSYTAGKAALAIAEEELAKAEAEYAAVLDEQGVCAHCPLR